MSSGQLDQDQARKRDLELARRAGRGDRGAFHQIVDSNAQALFGLAVTLVGNHADARLDLPTLLDTLTEDQRQVLVLREIERLSYQEIADVLEIPLLSTTTFCSFVREFSPLEARAQA